MPTPPQPERLPLSCPYCGRGLIARVADAQPTIVYQCRVHGQFRIESDGRLRDVPRA